MISIIDDVLIQIDIAAVKNKKVTLMNRNELNTSRHEPFVRGPHFRFFIISLVAAFILAMVAIVGTLVIFSLLFR